MPEFKVEYESKITQTVALEAILKRIGNIQYSQTPFKVLGETVKVLDSWKGSKLTYKIVISEPMPVFTTVFKEKDK